MTYPEIPGLKPAICRAPSDAATGAETTEAGDAAGAAAAQAAGESAGAAAQDAGAGDGAGPRWWEDARFDEGTQALLKAKGLTSDDPLDAVSRLAAMERAAQAKMGKPADQLLDRPGDDQNIADWLRQHGDLFGVPEAPESYEIAPPEGWPEDAPWDKDFEDRARKLAHEGGVPQAALQKFTELYAEKVKTMLADAETEYQAAAAQMQKDLQKDWGEQYGARVALAQQAASTLAAQAGLDDAAMQALAGALKPKIGDANVVRLFAAVGEMAGEDMASAMTGRGGGGLGTTPAEARQQLEEMKAPDSAYSKEMEKVRQGGSRARYDDLHRQYLQLQKIAAQ